MENSAGCRILVVSSTTAQAQQFVQRVKSITDKRESVPPPTPGDVTTLTHASDAASSSIPWTITNKYYTADVHFETREYASFAGYHASEAPAVIYVWSRGDPYKEHVPLLAEKLQHYDPEVSLAVRLSDAQQQAALYEKDEEDGLDEFLSTHGFEYVDGDRGGRRPTEDGGSFSDEDSLGVPGLPRVIDALSTIMWPSLVQSAATSARKSRARELLDWAREEEADDGLRALVSPEHDDTAVEGESQGEPKKKSRMQREMDELERWLEEEDAGRRRMDDAEAWGGNGQNALGGSGGGDAWADVPTPLVHTPGAQEGLNFGFEDDFAEFVGAPMEVSYDHGRTHEDAHEGVRVHHTGASYRSLASGPEHGGDDIFGEEGDPDLPSRTEIEETSRRIFGQSLEVPRTDASHGGSSNNTRSPAKPRGISLPGPTSTTSGPEHDESDGGDEYEDGHSGIPYHPLDDDSFLGDPAVDDDDFELGAFDLSRVLGALQSMKEEIAAMQDEDERRRAAARAALGLVYGLQKEEDREEMTDL